MQHGTVEISWNGTLFRPLQEWVRRRWWNNKVLQGPQHPGGKNGVYENRQFREWKARSPFLAHTWQFNSAGSQTPERCSAAQCGYRWEEGIPGIWVRPSQLGELPDLLPWTGGGWSRAYPEFHVSTSEWIGILPQASSSSPLPPTMQTLDWVWWNPQDLRLWSCTCVHRPLAPLFPRNCLPLVSSSGNVAWRFAVFHSNRYLVRWCHLRLHDHRATTLHWLFRVGAAACNLQDHGHSERESLARIKQVAMLEECIIPQLAQTGLECHSPDSARSQRSWPSWCLFNAFPFLFFRWLFSLVICFSRGCWLMILVEESLQKKLWATRTLKVWTKGCSSLPDSLTTLKQHGYSSVLNSALHFHLNNDTDQDPGSKIKWFRFSAQWRRVCICCWPCSPYPAAVSVSTKSSKSPSLKPWTVIIA